jgi:hypothetical protein
VLKFGPKYGCIIPRSLILYRALMMLSVITNIYNKKTKEPTLMELFTATGNLKKFF